MKPERQIRATYADILDNADPATLRVIGDLDALYTSAPTPTTPPFNTLLATRARASSRPGADDGVETAIGGVADGSIPPRSRSGWLRQGFAFAGAALAFALVATVLVLLFRDGDRSSTPGAQPTSVPAVTATANEILYLGPDGRSLLSAFPNDLGTRVILTSDGPLRSPVWSPDGSRVAFSGVVGNQSGVFVVSVEGSGLQLIAEAVLPIVDLDIAWSPDGSQFAFRRVTASDLDSGGAPPGSGLATRQGNAQNSDDQYIYVVTVDGSGLRRLNDGGQVGAPTWAPDSQRLAFTQSAPSPGGTTHNLVVVDLASGETRQITEGTNVRPNPQWSLDGRLILFAAGPGNGRHLVTVFVDGGAPNSGLRVLIDANENETGGKWSPDGQLIAFYSNRDGQPGIWVVNADGSDPRRAVAIAGGARFDWSPDGRRIAYVTDPGRNLPYRLFSVSVDGEDTQLHADDLHHTTQPDWSPVLASPETATPEPTEPTPTETVPAPPTPTRSAQPPTGPLTPNALENLAPLQPGQERHFVFDISADYRLGESSFLAWNVKGSERMLANGTLQTYMIARDADYNGLIEYVNDGERWWWNQRGWIEGGTTAAGVAELPEELRVAMMEQHNVNRAVTEGFDVIDERIEGDVQITRYRLDNMEWIEQQLGLSIESAYYEVRTIGDPIQVTRTRTVLVTPDDDGQPEYALADITYESVIIIGAEDGPGNYVVPEPLAEGTLQYTPPTTLPNGLTIENHWREFPGGMERMQITSLSGIRIDVNIYPSRGGHDPRPMDNLARMRGEQTAGGEIAGGTISWFAAPGWPTGVAWDDGRYRLVLNITNVTSREQWDENGLVALIYALAGEEPD